MLFNLLGPIGIGDRTKNNGILFLIATDDRQLRIEVGNGLEGAIPDGKAGRILDNYVVPYLKNNEWDNGIKNGFNAILEEVCKEYNIEIDGRIVAISNSSELSNEETAAFGLTFILFIITIIARIKIKKEKSKLLFAFRFYCYFNIITMLNHWRYRTFRNIFNNKFYLCYFNIIW